MNEFNREKLEEFLGVVRKYMQVRGPLSQKDLAVKTRIGVSTMSRFMSMKTADINPQIIAKICAHLDIPLHEMIDFVEEQYTERFVRLVKFYKADMKSGPESEAIVNDVPLIKEGLPSLDEALLDSLSVGTAKTTTNANVKVGNKNRTIPFTADETDKNSHASVKDKLDQLSPRQKAYMSDFLSLDMEARDLIVDLGNDLFRYFRQRGMIVENK